MASLTAAALRGTSTSSISRKGETVRPTPVRLQAGRIGKHGRNRVLDARAVIFRCRADYRFQLSQSALVDAHFVWLLRPPPGLQFFR